MSLRVARYEMRVVCLVKSANQITNIIALKMFTRQMQWGVKTVALQDSSYYVLPSKAQSNRSANCQTSNDEMKSNRNNTRSRSRKGSRSRSSSSSSSCFKLVYIPLHVLVHEQTLSRHSLVAAGNRNGDRTFALGTSDHHNLQKFEFPNFIFLIYLHT